MRISTFKTALPLMLAAALIAAPSCIFSPEEVTDIPPKPAVEWPEMTDRDDVLEVIQIAYDNPDDAESSAKYEEVLHSQYLFHLADIDYVPGEPTFFSRAEDIASTNYIFNNQSSLELRLALAGSWEPEPVVDGEPCDDCWLSEREYYISVQFGDDETTYQSPTGRTTVIVIVAPDENDATKWVLRAMYDKVAGG